MNKSNRLGSHGYGSTLNEFQRFSTKINILGGVVPARWQKISMYKTELLLGDGNENTEKCFSAWGGGRRGKGGERRGNHKCTQNQRCH